MKEALTKANLPLVAPSRGDNAKAGDAKTPGTLVANIAQQAYFADVATKVVLPMFKARSKPFVLVFWSRDPDGSQHNTRRQPQHRDARHQRADLDGRHQERRRQSGAIAQGARRSRPCRHHQHHHHRRPRLLDDFEGEQVQPVGESEPTTDTPKDFLPMGFLAIDLAKALDLPLFDPNDKNARVAENAHPKAGNGVLGKDPDKARSRGRHQRRIGPDLSAEQGQEAGGRARSRRCSNRIMSAGCSSTTSSGASPARCRCRSSI